MQIAMVENGKAVFWISDERIVDAIKWLITRMMQGDKPAQKRSASKR